MRNPDTRTAQDLRMLLGPLHRAVTRAAPAPEPVASFSPAQLELLRTVAEFGPLTTTQIAARLSLARSTVSNLVKTLTQAQMLTRELSQTDFRAALIDLSPEARRNLDSAGLGRLAVLQEAIDRLPEGEREILDSALPVLNRVLESLQEAGSQDTSGQQ